MLKNSAGQTQLNADIEGYFTDGSTNASGNGYFTIDPVRALAVSEGIGDLGSDPLKGGTPYTQQIAGLGDIPDDATAVFANVRVSAATGMGGLRIAASDVNVGAIQPTLNYQASTDNETGATIKLGPDGKIKFQSTALSTSTYNVVIDVTGYFTGTSAGGGFHPLNGVRLYDGRGGGDSPAVNIAPGSYVDVPVAGVAGIPDDGSAAAVATTIIAVHWTAVGGGTISVYDPEEAPGETSNAAYKGDADKATVGVVTTTITAISGANGTIRIRNNSGVGTVQVALAAQGWFTAPPTDPAEIDEAENAGSQEPTSSETTQNVDDTQCTQDVETQLAGTTDTSSDIADAVSQTCNYDVTTDTDAPESVTIINDSDESLTDAPASPDTAAGPDAADGSTITSSQATSMTSADGTTLAAAAMTRTIYWTRWSQYRISATWKETNSGTFYFDRAGHVWSTTMTYGYKGKHQCIDNYSVGYTISHTQCNTERRYDLTGAGGHPISEWDIFKVSAFYKGFPIAFTHKQHINAYANGTIGWH